MTVRASFSDFAIANNAYIGATVTLFTVDANGAKTTTKATLYSASTGAATLLNPQTLDSAGKFAAAVYVEEAVIATVSGLTIADHDTGIFHPTGSFKGDWVTATLYYAGEYVRAGSAADSSNDIYSVDKTHTSGTFATDKTAGDVVLMIDVSNFMTSLTAAARTLLDDATTAAMLTTLAAAGTGIVNTFTATQSWTKGADIASADPLVLGTDGNYFDVTGTTGFASITVAAGTFFVLQFDDAVPLTHHATNLDLPGEANFTTAAGTIAICFATAANQVQVLALTKADGKAVVPPAAASDSVAGLIEIATDAEADTGTDTVRALVPSTFGGSGRKNHADPGYQKLPGGLIIQWGRTSLSTNQLNKSVTLPVAFPTAIFQATTGIGTSIPASALGMVTAVATSTTTITLDNSADSSMTAAWIAIGR